MLELSISSHWKAEHTLSIRASMFPAPRLAISPCLRCLAAKIIGFLVYLREQREPRLFRDDQDEAGCLRACSALVDGFARNSYDTTLIVTRLGW